jgi:hypothetical protein
MSALGQKPDITCTHSNVCKVPKADMPLHASANATTLLRVCFE